DRGETPATTNTATEAVATVQTTTSQPTSKTWRYANAMKTVASASASCRVKVRTYVWTSGSAKTRRTFAAPRLPCSAACSTSDRDTVANAESAATNTAATARKSSAAAKNPAIAISVFRGVRHVGAARFARREVGEQEAPLQAEHLRLLIGLGVVVAHEVEQTV